MGRLSMGRLNFSTVVTDDGSIRRHEAACCSDCVWSVEVSDKRLPAEPNGLGWWECHFYPPRPRDVELTHDSAMYAEYIMMVQWPLLGGLEYCAHGLREFPELDED